MVKTRQKESLMEVETLQFQKDRLQSDNLRLQSIITSLKFICPFFTPLIIYLGRNLNRQIHRLTVCPKRPGSRTSSIGTSKKSCRSFHSFTLTKRTSLTWRICHDAKVVASMRVGSCCYDDIWSDLSRECLKSHHVKRKAIV